MYITGKLTPCYGKAMTKETKYEEKKKGKTNIPGGCNLGAFWGGGGEDESLGHWNSTSYLGQNKTEQKTP